MQDFFRHNVKCQDTLKKITNPLKLFGIDVFGHQTTHENGHLSNICNHHEMWAHFYDSQCYKDAAHYVAPSCLTPGYFHLDFDPQFDRVRSELEKKLHCITFSS